MERNARIYVAGSNTFIGAAILKALQHRGYTNLIAEPTADWSLQSKAAVDAFFARNKPEYVFLVAGKSAGIMGNIKFPADLMLENLLIACHVIESARRYRVKKLLYLASSCCYPQRQSHLIKEEDLLTGPLEVTSECYSVAKIAGIKLVESYRSQFGSNFICGIPANIFGPGDDFTSEDSHVIGALIGRMQEAKEKRLSKLVIWGTGKPRREFIYVDDLADACNFIMEHYDEKEPINLGSGNAISIAELADMIKAVTGFKGDLFFDSSKPDGVPIKLLDSTKLKKLGWGPTFSFPDAIRFTYDWYCKHYRL